LYLAQFYKDEKHNPDEKVLYPPPETGSCSS